MNGIEEKIVVGTKLFNTRFNIVGTVIKLEFRFTSDKTEPWFSVDSDDEYFWLRPDVRIVNEKEYLVLQLKNTKPNRLNV